MRDMAQKHEYITRDHLAQVPFPPPFPKIDGGSFGRFRATVPARQRSKASALFSMTMGSDLSISRRWCRMAASAASGDLSAIA